MSDLFEDVPGIFAVFGTVLVGVLEAIVALLALIPLAIILAWSFQFDPKKRWRLDYIPSLAAHIWFYVLAGFGLLVAFIISTTREQGSPQWRRGLFNMEIIFWASGLTLVGAFFFCCGLWFLWRWRGSVASFLGQGMSALLRRGSVRPQDLPLSERLTEPEDEEAGPPAYVIEDEQELDESPVKQSDYQKPMAA